MGSFQDAKGDSWSIDLTFGAILRVKKESNGKFDLLEPLKDGLDETLNSNYPEFFEVLWYICEPQAAERKITAEEFGARIAAKCLFEAQRAFWKEWSSFFRDLQRANVAAALETKAELTAKALEAIRLQVEAETKGLVERATPKMNEVLKKESGSFQALLDKTLSPEPGDSSTTSDAASAG